MQTVQVLLETKVNTPLALTNKSKLCKQKVNFIINIHKIIHLLKKLLHLQLLILKMIFF